jgi:hypothetical protein
MPPYPPAPQRTDRRAVTAFILSLVGLLFTLSEGRRNGEYADDVARGVGANLPAFVFAIVALAVAIGAVRRSAGRGQRGKGLAIAAIILACLVLVSCVLHVVGLVVATSP